MKSKHLLLKLQKKYKTGGYALVSPKSGQVVIFSEDIKSLYQTIDKEKINDTNKLVMYVPPPHVKHVFQLSLSIRVH
jgi:dTDP-4-dehydrorhamnose 3,5-epimerase-like enzyme